MTGDRVRWCCNDLDETIELVTKRNRQGIRCIIDPLGELAKDDAAAERALSDIVQTIEAISQNSLDASIALKPTALGTAYDPDACLDRAKQVTRIAWNEGIAVELDMEGRKYVDETLHMATFLIKDGQGQLTIALQAYLYRTPMDSRRMGMSGVKVRLVKGAYAGDMDDFDGITAAMMDNIDLLSTMRRPFSIGTHDPRVIERIMKHQDLRDLIEIGMLKGLGDETKIKLSEKGWAVAEYVPYGKDSYAYITRRENYLRNLGKLGFVPCP